MNRTAVVKELLAVSKLLAGLPPPIPKGHYSNNGAMTKDILKVCKTHESEPNVIYTFVSRVLAKWPLSSTKVVYDEDIAGFPHAVKEAVLKACEESDKRKWEGSFEMAKRMGADDAKAKSLAGDVFGRYRP